MASERPPRRGSPRSTTRTMGKIRYAKNSEKTKRRIGVRSRYRRPRPATKTRTVQVTRAARASRKNTAPIVYLAGSRARGLRSPAAGAEEQRQGEPAAQHSERPCDQPRPEKRHRRQRGEGHSAL